MKKRKKLIIVVVIIVLLGGGVFAYFHFHKKTASVTYQTAQATKGTLTATVSGSGNIVVSESADVKPSISGTVANLKVSVGDEVKKGQALFTITNDDLDVTVSKAYTTLLQARQKLTDAKSSLDTAKQDYNSLLKSAVTEAQLAYDQANQNLLQAKYQFEQDEDTLQKYEDENEENSGTHTQVEIYLTEQKITVDKTTITSKESEVFSAKNDLARAKAGTSSTISVAKSKVDSAEVNVQTAENDVNAAQLDYDNQKKTAAERTVTAPINGTLSAVNVGNGDQLGSTSSSNASSSSASNSAAITIQNLSSLKAVVDINEVDIAKVKVDQKASMTFDAISDLTLTGKVEKVDTVGTSTQGVVSYSATIGFDSLDERVRPEMSVNTTITTEVKQDVLIVSSSAVKTSGTTHYVQILENGSPVQQTVEIGATSDTQTEITSGLSEGTSVVTQTITANQTSTTNTNSSRSNTRNFEGDGMITGPGGMF